MIALSQFMGNKGDVESRYIAVIFFVFITAVSTGFIDSCIQGFVGLYSSTSQAFFQFGIGLSILLSSFLRIFTKGCFKGSINSSTVVFFFLSCFISLVSVKVFYLLRNSVTNDSPSFGHQKQGESSKNMYGDQEALHNLLRRIKPSLLNIFFVFTLLCLFWPSLIASIPTLNTSLGTDSWWSILLLSVFSVFDLIGRSVVFYRFGLNADNMWKIILFQALLFIPLISCCILGLVHDSVSILLVMAIGFSSGYTASLSIILVGDCKLSDANERGVAGILTGLTIYCGLTFGSLLAILLHLSFTGEVL